jgi:hypothetical protein
MKTYYLHNGKEPNGPFHLEELKTKSITKLTPIWCTGMEDWKTAGELEELKSILDSFPPPIKSFTSIPPIPKAEKKVEHKKIVGLSKNKFFLTTGILILLIVMLVTNNVKENRKATFERKNNETEKNNQQYKLQQKEIQEQKNQITEQENLELERAAKEEKQAINNRILEIKNSLTLKYSNLKAAKFELDKTNDFQFFRTSNQKKEQINLAQNNIEYLKTEIRALEKEINLLYLKLEKIN